MGERRKALPRRNLEQKVPISMEAMTVFIGIMIPISTFPRVISRLICGSTRVDLGLLNTYSPRIITGLITITASAS
jgi:hypothetical protein